MRNLKLIALGAVALLGFAAPDAHANPDIFSPYPPTAIDRPMANQPHKKHHHKNKMKREQKLEVRRYLSYEQREPCQNYRPVPPGFYRDGCALKRINAPTAQPAPQQPGVSNVLSSYEVNFAFDKTGIESAAMATLDQVAKEIKQYNPREVIIAGHADKAGPSDYNVTLSKQRAQAVSRALTARGVANRILDQEAYGETDPAVPTQDGVPLRENRRVVIEFRK